MGPMVLNHQRFNNKVFLRIEENITRWEENNITAGDITILISSCTTEL